MPIWCISFYSSILVYLHFSFFLFPTSEGGSSAWFTHPLAGAHGWVIYGYDLFELRVK
jgi:hypothetical protein